MPLDSAPFGGGASWMRTRDWPGSHRTNGDGVAGRRGVFVAAVLHPLAREPAVQEWVSSVDEQDRTMSAAPVRAC